MKKRDLLEDPRKKDGHDYSDFEPATCVALRVSIPTLSDASIKVFLGPALPIGSHFALIVGLTIAVVAIPLINAVLESPVLRLCGVSRGLRSSRIILLTNVGAALPYLGFLYYASIANR